MRKVCSRVPYESSAAAKAALVHVRSRRHKGKRRERRTYRCSRCGFWHLTSMTK